METVCGIASNIDSFAFEINKCGNLFSKRSLSLGERISYLSDVFYSFITTQRAGIKDSYKEFLQSIREMEGMAASNEKAMGYALYHIPVNEPSTDLIFDRRYFFISSEFVGIKKITQVKPISYFMFEVICAFHETLVSNEEKIKRISSETSSGFIEGKNLKLWWINNAIKNGQIFLNEKIDVDEILLYEGKIPSLLKPGKNVLFHPTNPIYPVFDAVFMHSKNGINRVSFIQKTKIEKSGFARKVMKIQQELGLDFSPTNGEWLVDRDGACNEIFTQWMKKLVEFGFKPQTTEFVFWLIYKDDDSYYMESNQFLKCFNHLCFDDSGSNFRTFLNCQSNKDYLKYYAPTNKETTIQASKSQRNK